MEVYKLTMCNSSCLQLTKGQNWEDKEAFEWPLVNVCNCKLKYASPGAYGLDKVAA